MYELKKMERYLRVNLLGPGPRLMKKNLPGRGLTKVQKYCSTAKFLVTTHRNHSWTVETMALKWENTEGRHAENEISKSGDFTPYTEG